MKIILSRAYLLFAAFFCHCDDLAITRFLDSSPGVRISVRVSGLLGAGLVLSSGAESLPVSADSTYTFTGRFRKKQFYSIQVVTHPSKPNQHCLLTGGNGVAGEGDITLRVTCVPGSAAGPMIGGTIIQPLNISGNADLILGQIFAGSTGVSAAIDGTGSAARFTLPTHMVTDGVYIYLQESNPVGTLRRITIATREVTTLGDSGGSDGITTDGLNLYFTSYNSCTVRKTNIDNFNITVLAGANNVCDFNDSATGTAVRFNNPLAITHDGTWLYIADYTNNRIRRVDPVTGATTTLAGTGVATSSNGPAAAATFRFPHGLTYYEGKLYVAESDSAAQWIRTIDLTAAPYNVTTFSGTGAWGCADGAAGVTQFKKLRNLMSDGRYLYATDKECYNIRRIDLVSGFSSTLSGWETRTTTVIGTGGGLTGTAGFREPMGITADGTYLYVTDASDFILRRLE
jgi:hypothetical protein